MRLEKPSMPSAVCCQLTQLFGSWSHLIEDYGDEWLTKAMYHYRWHHLYGDAIAKASNMLPLMSDNQMDVSEQRYERVHC